MKSNCSEEMKDYCAGAAWKSGEHTMCKYCVSCNANKEKEQEKFHSKTSPFPLKFFFCILVEFL